MTDPWEANAGWWQAGFTDGADPEYEEQILPLARRVPRRRTAPCSTSAAARAKSPRSRSRRVERVVGVDPTWAQLAVAARRAGGPAYARGGAAGCRSATTSFDAVVACLVFEHIVAVDDGDRRGGPRAAPGGRFAFFLNHPLLQTPNSGWIDDQMLDPPEQYWRIGHYLVEDETLEEVEKGVFIPFIHRPLSRYVNAIAANGLSIERMEEPAPPPGFLARAAEYARRGHHPAAHVLAALARGRAR